MARISNEGIFDFFKKKKETITVDYEVATGVKLNNKYVHEYFGYNDDDGFHNLYAYLTDYYLEENMGEDIAPAEASKRISRLNKEISGGLKTLRQTATVIKTKKYPCDPYEVEVEKLSRIAPDKENIFTPDGSWYEDLQKSKERFKQYKFTNLQKVANEIEKQLDIIVRELQKVVKMILVNSAVNSA